jgi:hypothetical protein
MEEIVFDLETDGLIETVETIWCATFHNVDKDTTISFVPNGEEDKSKHIYPISSLPKWLDNGKDKYTWICHNLMKYDRAVLHILLGIMLPKENCQDSFIWSQMLYPDIAIPKGCKGRHGLEAWGVRFSIPKPEHEDWSRYSSEMLHRNREDVKINTQLWLKIKEKINVASTI